MASHIVVTGNPGVGKSTIANTLIGSIHFESGVRVGRTMHTVLQTHTINGIKYSDTPGLDDIEVRQRAAQEISRALNRTTRLKLIFVVTLESGRIRPADIATIDVILTAIEAVGVDANDGFSLLVNCCDDAQVQQLADAQTASFVTGRFGNGRVLTHVDFLPVCLELRGSSNRLFPDRARLVNFLEQAPSMCFQPVVDVRSEEFDQSVEEANEELTRLRAELQRLEDGKSSWLFSIFTWIVGGFACYLGRAFIAGLRLFL